MNLARKFTFTAAFAFAITFTFNCSSGDGNDDPPNTGDISSSSVDTQSSSSSVVTNGSSSSADTQGSSSSVVEEDSSSSVNTQSSSSSVVAEVSSSSVDVSSSSVVVSSSSSEEASSSSETPKCNGTEYDLENQRCEANIIETKCGTGWYNEVNTDLRCKNNIIQTKCGTSWYNPAKQMCDADNNMAIVTIGEQTWMAENLNINVADSKCYDNDPDNCIEYGRLYDWDMAQNACPAGWHLPIQDEWNTLTNYIQTDKGCTNCDAKHLKATSGWNSDENVLDGNGLDSYGFAALPGGDRYSDGGFYNVGKVGLWWSATEYNANRAYYLDIYYPIEKAGLDDYGKTNLLSVRCVKD